MSRKLGASFSHHHLTHLGLNPETALQKSFSLGLSHLRLGAYWNELEILPGRYEFSPLEKLLQLCQNANQPVVLTVGVKAPRWPEFYWPDFIADKQCGSPQTQELILAFITTTIQKLSHFSCITHWQVENEPLDPSGPNQDCFDPTFLGREVALVRSLDTRPVILTLWGNALKQRGLFATAQKLADVVGIDLYYKHFVLQLAGKNIYTGPQQSDKQLAALLQASSKPVWIAELQAEPWEKNEAAYMSASPASISVAQLQKNLDRTANLPIEETLLWGLEYWLWRAEQRDTGYLDFIQSQVY